MLLTVTWYYIFLIRTSSTINPPSERFGLTYFFGDCAVQDKHDKGRNKQLHFHLSQHVVFFFFYHYLVVRSDFVHTRSPVNMSSFEKLACAMLRPAAKAAAAPAAAAQPSAAPGLLLLLHGSGDNEHGLLEFGKCIAPSGYTVVSLRAPVFLGGGYTDAGGAVHEGAYAWFEGASARPAPIALESTIGNSCDSIFQFIEASCCNKKITTPPVFR